MAHFITDRAFDEVGMGDNRVGPLPEKLSFFTNILYKKMSRKKAPVSYSLFHILFNFFIYMIITQGKPMSPVHQGPFPKTFHKK